MNNIISNLQVDMKGGGKVYTSIAPIDKTKPKPSIKIYRDTKKKFKTLANAKKRYGLKKPLKTLKRKIKETEEDTSDIGVIKSFILCKKFIKVFLKKYDIVMNSNSVEKQSNYEIFASMLVTNIATIVNEYDNIITDEDLHVINDEKLYSAPEEYLEDFIDFIEEDDVLEDFANIAIKYYDILPMSNTRMEMNNNNNVSDLREDYLEYYGLLHDTSKAVMDVIKNYSLELKTKNKISENVNINSLISGLTAIKIKGVNTPKENIKVIIEKSRNNNLNEDFFASFSRLGL